MQPNLNPEDKVLMEKLLSAGHIEHKYAVRTQTVLLRARGKGTGEISEFLGIDRATVSSHINRYNDCGVDSLSHDKTRRPGNEPASRKIHNEICRLVCKEKPKDETRWSCRPLAGRVGISHTAVHTILKESGLKPHIVEKENYSSDAGFEAKLEGAVGLYLKPPKNATVLCADEKTQIRALERAQPVLPVIRNCLNGKARIIYGTGGRLCLRHWMF